MGLFSAAVREPSSGLKVWYLSSEPVVELWALVLVISCLSHTIFEHRAERLRLSRAAACSVRTGSSWY